MVHALRGKEHVEWDNPYDVGMTGFIGFSSGYHAMLECDALLMLGTDFPYRQFLSDEGEDRAGRSATPSALGRRARWISVSSAMSAQTRAGADAAPEAQKRSDASSTAARKHYVKSARRTDELARPSPGKRRSIRNICAQASERTRGERRHFHRRCRHADGLGGALSRDERQAAADRLVQSRLDGERHAAGDRRAGGLSRPAGHLAVRRRRFHAC